LDVAGVMLLALDREGRIVLINRKGCELLGYEEGELLGKSWFETCLPPRLGEEIRRVAEQILGGDVAAVEYHENPVLTRSGEERIIAWHNRALKDAEGRGVGMLSSGEDITDQRRAEAQIRTSLERLQSLVRILQYIPASTQDFLDYALNEVLTLTESKVGYIYYYDEKTRQFTLNTWSKEVMHECTVTNPQTIYDLDKTGIWGEAVRQRKPIMVNDFDAPNPLKKGYPPGHVQLHRFLTVPVFSGERIVAVVGVANKATDYDESDVLQLTLLMGSVWHMVEQQRSEAALRESEERFRALVESSADHVFILDAEGRYLFSNDRTHQLSDAYSENLGCGQDLVGRHVAEVYPQQEAQLYMQRIAQVLEQDRPVQFEHTLPNGEALIYHVDTLYPIHRDGKPWAVGGICHDVTALRQMEERLRQGEKLQAIGTLAGGVAHEFNNLLTVINGYADIVMRVLGPANALYGEVAEIAKAGNRAAGLTKQLLAFGRKQTMYIRPLNLNDLLRGMEKMLAPVLPENIVLNMVLAPDLGIVRGEQTQLEQVVLNLATNARDAMPAGGTLTLGTRNLEITDPGAVGVELPAGRYVLLTVEDTGHGMPPEVLKHLFEPFYTTKEVGRGTGLGLATVYGIIKQLEGDIRVRSEVGQGTTFSIYLPCVKETARPEAPTMKEAIARGTQTILVVEDNAGVRQLAARLLRSFGYAVVQAADATAALETMQSSNVPIDLVLTDVIMPDLSGPQLAAKLQALRPGLPVLYMSGYADDFLSTRGFGQASGNLVRKPFEPAQLAEQVRRALTKAQGG